MVYGDFTSTKSAKASSTLSNSSSVKRVSLAEMTQGIPSAFLLPEERQPLAKA